MSVWFHANCARTMHYYMHLTKTSHAKHATSSKYVCKAGLIKTYSHWFAFSIKFRISASCAPRRLCFNIRTFKSERKLYRFRKLTWFLYHICCRQSPSVLWAGSFLNDRLTYWHWVSSPVFVRANGSPLRKIHVSPCWIRARRGHLQSV